MEVVDDRLRSRDTEALGVMQAFDQARVDFVRVDAARRRLCHGDPLNRHHKAEKPARADRRALQVAPNPSFPQTLYADKIEIPPRKIREPG